jgi:fermentation-respiration switch protein FrsA (DUF1100 family)
MVTKLLVLVGLVAGLLTLLWAFQRTLIYMPMGVPGEPSRAGVSHARAVRFQTEDALTLHAWFVPSSSLAGPAVATVLVFNGNAGNRALRAPLAAGLSRRGFDTLLVDYRGFGDNDGHPTEAGLASDARAAWRYLVEEAGVSPARLAFFGESLGSGVAVRLALEHRPAALILRSPFTSLIDVARRQFFFLPLRWMLWDQYRSIDRIARIGCPLLVIAGTRDSVVPYEQSVRLFEAASEPKRFLALDADHNDWEMLAGTRLLDEVAAFLRRRTVSE